MAHFRAVLQGNPSRSVASRLGHKTTGIWARVQTWGYDVVVDASHDGKHDWAVIRVVKHDEDSGSLVARINLTTGEVLQ